MSQNQGLLHRNKLEDFLGFLEAKGFSREPAAAQYEIVRMRRIGPPIIIYFRRGTEHLTVHNGFEFVEEWLKARKG